MNITTQPGKRPAKKDGRTIHGVVVFVDGTEAGFVHESDSHVFGSGIPYCSPFHGRDAMIRSVAEKYRAEQSETVGAGGWPLVMPDAVDNAYFPNEPVMACPACGAVRVEVLGIPGRAMGGGWVRGCQQNVCKACGKRETY